MDGPVRRRRSTPLRRALALKPPELCRRLDPKSLPFATTAEIEPLAGTIGQPRALEAIEFGIQIETRGYNLFVSGLPGSGLTGRQGVIVPATNVQHLMLSDEVVEAVRRRRFHVWAVRSVDEGIELLTGRPAAEVHRLVAERIADYAEKAKEAAGGPSGETPMAAAGGRAHHGAVRGRKGG